MKCWRSQTVLHWVVWCKVWMSLPLCCLGGGGSSAMKIIFLWCMAYVFCSESLTKGMLMAMCIEALRTYHRAFVAILSILFWIVVMLSPGYFTVHFFEVCDLEYWRFIWVHRYPPPVSTTLQFVYPVVESSGRLRGWIILYRVLLHHVLYVESHLYKLSLG